MTADQRPAVTMAAAPPGGRADAAIARAHQPRPAQILQVATNLFRARGFHGTRMDDIADSSKLNKATLYHYYANKATLLFEICMEAIQAISAELGAGDPECTPSQALSFYTHRLFAVIAENPDRAMVYFQESPFLTVWLPGDAVRTIRMHEDVFEAHLREIMQRGVQDGTFRDFDPRLIALGYSGLTNWFCRWYHPGGPQSPDEIADQFVSLVLEGLATDPQSSSGEGE